MIFKHARRRIHRGDRLERHTAALDMPPFRAARTASSFSPEIAVGPPSIRPRARAAANPAATRSRARACSYWASAPNTWNSNSPDTVWYRRVPESWGCAMRQAAATLDRWRAEGRQIDLQILHHMTPMGFKGVNFGSR